MQVIHLRIQVDNIAKQRICKKIQWHERWMNILPPAFWLGSQLKMPTFLWTKESQLKSLLLRTIKEKGWPLLVKWVSLLWLFSPALQRKKEVSREWEEIRAWRCSPQTNDHFFHTSSFYKLVSKRSLFVWLKNSLTMCRNESQLGFSCVNLQKKKERKKEMLSLGTQFVLFSFFFLFIFDTPFMKWRICNWFWNVGTN